MVEFKCSESQYEPHKLRAHPLYFYKFPVYVVFLTIIYWLVLCPLVYGILVIKLEHLLVWMVPFFILSLILYLIFICILLCIWRCKYHDKENYSIYFKNRENSIYLVKPTKSRKENQFIPLCPQKSSKKEFSCSCKKNNCRYCSVSKTSKLTILSEKLPTMDQSVVMHQTPYEECEYFIANVPSPTICTSEVYLYVEDCKPQPQPQTIKMTLVEESEDEEGQKHL